MIRWVALAAGACACATLAGAAPAGAQECSVGRITDTSYEARLCELPPDLDQLRLESAGGLPDNGTYYCVPTSTMNVLAYLTGRGFARRPENRNWLLPDNYGLMSNRIEQLARHMGISARGTPLGGGASWQTGVTEWLSRYGQGPTAQRGGYTVTTAFGITSNGGRRSGYYMALDMLDGQLDMPAVGYYREHQDAEGSFFERAGGHQMTLVGITGARGELPGLEYGSVLEVRDPATPVSIDGDQDPYSTETLRLDPDREVRLRTLSGRMVTVRLSSVGGVATSMYDGSGTLGPQLAITASGPGLRVTRAYRLIPGVPREETLKVPGEVSDVTISPLTREIAYLRRGSPAITLVDRAEGSLRTVKTGSAPLADLAYGGNGAELYVAGGREVFMLQDGKPAASKRVPEAIDELEWDEKHNRVVALSSDAESLFVLNSDLRLVGTAAIPDRTTPGTGDASLAIAPDGKAVIRVDGAPSIASFKFTKGVKASARIGAKVNARPKTVRALGSSRELAIGDNGHLVVIRGGKLLELTASGERVKNSPYTGLPAKGAVALTRSFLHYDPSIMPTIDEKPEDYQPVPYESAEKP